MHERPMTRSDMVALISRETEKFLAANPKPRRRRKGEGKPPTDWLTNREPPRPPAPRADQGVYVIANQDGAVKIGIAADVRKRLSGLQTATPYPLKLRLFVGDLQGRARQIEKECHRRLDQHRVSGEWFKVEWREAVDVVRRVVAAHSSPA